MRIKHARAHAAREVKCGECVAVHALPADAGLVGERLLARVLGAPELLAGLLHDASSVDRGGVALGDRLAVTLLEDLVRGGIAGELWRLWVGRMEHEI